MSIICGALPHGRNIIRVLNGIANTFVTAYYSHKIKRIMRQFVLTDDSFCFFEFLAFFST